MTRRARLGRYALYQAWDYVVERGIVTMVLIALTMGPPLALLWTSRARMRGVTETITSLLAGVAVPVATLAVLFAVNGMCSMDRQKGYYRFLFAKPASVPAYYALDFVVRLAGVMAIVLLALGVTALLFGVPLHAGFLAYVALVYVLLGSLGFLLSALLQADGVMLILVWLLSALALQFRDHFPTRIPLAAVRWLPPVDKLDVARNAWIGGEGALATGDLWWVIAYGAGCFVLGLVALRRRALAR